MNHWLPFNRDISGTLVASPGEVGSPGGESECGMVGPGHTWDSNAASSPARKPLWRLEGGAGDTGLGGSFRRSDGSFDGRSLWGSGSSALSAPSRRPSGMPGVSVASARGLLAFGDDSKSFGEIKVEDDSQVEGTGWFSDERDDSLEQRAAGKPVKGVEPAVEVEERPIPQERNGNQRGGTQSGLAGNDSFGLSAAR